MTRILTLFLIVFSVISCKTDKASKSFVTAKIKQFKMDSCSIRAIHSVSNDTLYYADSKGNIGHTFDNGQSWSKTSIKYNDSLVPHFRSIAVNNDTVFALSVANPALLYKTFNKYTELVYKEEHSKVFYDSMHFLDDGKHAIAVGDPTENCPSIIISSDYGNTWCKLSCDELPEFEEGEAFFAASNTNIKTLGNTIWIVSGGKKARVLKSSDMGKNWNIYTTPIVQGNGPQGIYSVDFYDQNNGIVFGGNYSNPEDNCANKAITKDGGKTWTLIADNQEPGYKSCVKYVPNSNGQEIVAIGKTGISYSKNGGENWSKISDIPFYTIQFVNEHSAWLGGPEKLGKLILN
ncbi:WD40/YVTN/BNR-like repeat-containing protein [Tenacibaculum xiamenense]|uniref:WD40/YVTN/BNR-like repeat-containing protein n=1 Tax=Tenacibaculum xiamenense TaxID=1261553 RepID=UPI003892DD93